METPKRQYKKREKELNVSISYFLRKSTAKEALNAADRLVKQAGDYFYGGRIYIQVVFLRQTMRIRSRLRMSLSEDDFDSFMQQPNVVKFVELESAAIRVSVRELMPETIENFSISQWTAFYQQRQELIRDYAERLISQRFIQEAQKLLKIDTPSVSLLLLSNFESIELASSMQMPLAMAYFVRYEPLFRLKTFEDNFLKDANFCILDWQSGYYQSVLRECYGESVEPLLAQIGELFSSGYIPVSDSSDYPQETEVSAPHIFEPAKKEPYVLPWLKTTKPI